LSAAVLHGEYQERDAETEQNPCQRGYFPGHGSLAAVSANDMWGGRFAAGPDDVMAAINVSIGFDRRLAKQDIEGSLAHVRMLEATGLISAEDSSAIQGGLNAVAAEIREGRFPFREAYEDIHMNVEARLAELIGPAAGRLHTARSRNDQVATDFRLWVRDAIDAIHGQVGELMAALADKALAHAGAVMPGFTHMQSAQPVTFGHHCLAFVEMFERDRGRLADARARLNESPLGSAALAGTSFPIDRAMTAAALGFARPMRNSLDAVSSRDFAMEFLAAGSILALAEGAPPLERAEEHLDALRKRMALSHAASRPTLERAAAHHASGSCSAPSMPTSTSSSGRSASASTAPVAPSTRTPLTDEVPRSSPRKASGVAIDGA
jgi:hypothetical protein